VILDAKFANGEIEISNIPVLELHGNYKSNSFLRVYLRKYSNCNNILSKRKINKVSYVLRIETIGESLYGTDLEASCHLPKIFSKTESK
jgi:hypothetical protein